MKAKPLEIVVWAVKSADLELASVTRTRIHFADVRALPSVSMSASTVEIPDSVTTGVFKIFRSKSFITSCAGPPP